VWWRAAVAQERFRGQVAFPHRGLLGESATAETNVHSNYGSPFRNQIAFGKKKKEQYICFNKKNKFANVILISVFVVVWR
jgi:hypothetical protein